MVDVILIEDARKELQNSFTPGTNVSVGYFSPDALFDSDVRRSHQRVLDFVNNQDGLEGEVNRNRARGVLTYWGFEKDEMEELQVGRLGRSAKTQLLLAIIMLRGPNLLVLDEPTADLPDKMVNRLLDAIRGYRGTIVAISHEQSFLENLSPNKILDLNEQKLIINAEI
jgi:ATPase subunit of ABC transporter with duplicated ATPase domains